MENSFLRKVPLFEGLKEEELEAIASVTVTRSFSKDQVIILAEEEGDALFIIHTGQVKVSIVSEDGREVILSMLGGGAVFGELSLLDGKPRSANVIATEDTNLVMLRRQDFLQLFGGGINGVHPYPLLLLFPGPTIAQARGERASDFITFHPDCSFYSASS